MAFGLWGKSHPSLPTLGTKACHPPRHPPTEKLSYKLGYKLLEPREFDTVDPFRRDHAKCPKMKEETVVYPCSFFDRWS